MERICPLLGLAVDRRTVVDGFDAGHRCHAGHQAQPIERGRQLQLCIGDGYVRCERFREHLEAFGDPRLTPLAAGNRFVPTRLVVAAEPAWVALAARPRAIRPGRLVAVAAAAALLALAGVAAASGALGPDPLASFTTTPPPSSEATLSGVSATPSVRQTPQPSVAVTPPPVASASPSLTVVPSATPSLTPAPTVVPTPSVPPPAPTAVAAPASYTVAEGDTLSSIAAQFGTTVQALMSANGIEDPDLIEIGQVLLIP